MYRKALAINPSHPQSWTNLGIAHAMMGDTAGALEPFRRGCEADPTNGDAWVNLAKDGIPSTTKVQRGTVFQLDDNEQHRHVYWARRPSLSMGFRGLKMS